MVYYCKHYKEEIDRTKAIRYCIRQGCWAYKIFKTIGELKKFHKSFLKQKYEQKDGLALRPKNKKRDK